MQLLTISRLFAIGVASTLSVSLLSQYSANAHENHAQISPTTQTSPTACHDLALIWPTQGEVSGGFNEGDYHLGIDIDAAPGTPIVAVADGEVVKAQWDDWGLGNAIKIRHDNGCYTVYGHNQENLVQVGQRVRQGEQIALMGNTGFTDFSHLHFEVRPSESDFIDPMLVLNHAPRTQTSTVPLNTNSQKYQQTAFVEPAAPMVIPCTGETIISEETANFRIHIYQSNNRLFYQGENKRNGATVCLGAAAISGDRYQAQNGSYSYIVDAKGYQVFRFGTLMREERFF
ncbi:MAG: M23 family metallopeptidase [Jaaginema sp. PMC 1079.18]|nr:M23 family metallopeptidase [Jaaginema sp. PMC 1080.18]MEC4852912.1 M23 family metallopeptidase [Jaaginema sp. PMC 1079.18]MEC4868791.1 M23 family metallopeptidase [Jaaginema sp. PMC 1078.18]